ncbi:integrase, catalytic region, zinc finger, CCHC-type containing protein [Tanacetum coccineum]
MNEKIKIHNFTPELRMTPIKEISTNKEAEGDDESYQPSDTKGCLRWRVAQEAVVYKKRGKDNGKESYEVHQRRPFQIGTVSDVIIGGTEGAVHMVNATAYYKSNHEVHANVTEYDGKVTNVDDDVDDSPENDLALNVDHVFEADECDAFDSDVDEGPTTQTMFMANLTSEDSIYDRCVPCIMTLRDAKRCTKQLRCLTSDADYTSDSNIIPYDQYVEDNEEHVVQSNVSSVRNDALMSILDEMHEQALTVYPPNTPVKLVPRILPTKSQVKINLYVLTQLFTEFDKTCKTRITPTGITEGERGFEQTKRCYLTEVIPFFKTLKEHFVGVQTALFKEVKEMEEIFDQMNNEVDKNTVDKQCAEIEKKNLLIENENLIVNCLSTQLLYDVEKSRCLDLEADMSKVHDESKLISKLEREYLNLQLKYQHLQESFDNKNSQASQEAPDFNSFFKIKNLEHQIQEKDNVIRHLKDLVANVNDRSREPYNTIDVTALIEQNDCDRVELEKVKQHYKELYDSIKITRAHTSEKTSTMLNEIESLKAQLRSKEPCFTSDYVKPKVLAPGMYAIDVKPIPHPLKNNRSAHLNYISHLKESVETVREIVEEARVVKPLDNSLHYACQYTKLSQELLECVIGTCPKSFNERDNKAPSTPVTRKKQVTFSDKPGPSSSNTQKHKVHQRAQQTNIPVIPSTGVNDSTEASGSKPRSNTKRNRILPAKKENKKEVEVRLRTNKSVWTKVNRVDSSSSSKRVVINSNSESVCKTCNKCVNSASHGMCFVNILNSVNATPTVRIVLNKEKQIWKPKGKLLFKTYDGESFKAQNFVEKSLGSVRSEMITLGAIMGYGDYGQFVILNLEVAFRKHTCFVRDINGTDILKGSRSTNLYTISIDEMMKSSPICLLSKASKSKSWLWHRRLKPFNFGFTWVKFLRSKDETPEFVINFLKQIQLGLNKTVRFIRTDNGTEFVNQVMSEYYEHVTMDDILKSAYVSMGEAVATVSILVLCAILQMIAKIWKFQAQSDIGILLVQHQDIAEDLIHEDTPINLDVLHPSITLRWTKDHPLDNIVGNPSRHVSTRKPLASDALGAVSIRNVKVETLELQMAVIEDCWFSSHAR